MAKLQLFNVPWLFTQSSEFTSPLASMCISLPLAGSRSPQSSADPLDPLQHRKPGGAGNCVSTGSGVSPCRGPCMYGSDLDSAAAAAIKDVRDLVVK